VVLAYDEQQTEVQKGSFFQKTIDQLIEENPMAPSEN